MTVRQSNWAGNYAYGAIATHRPPTPKQVCQLVARSDRIKALGTRHSFNGIADCTGDHCSTELLNRIVQLDRASQTVTVEAGVRYGHLGEFLHREGFALHNLASLPHISVAGACATATHGSGDGNGNLATVVVAMEVVTAGGELVTFARDRCGEEFDGMVVSLGGLGVITKLTLQIVPTFSVRQHVYENLPVTQIDNGFDAIFSSGYSVSLFTDWRHEFVNQLWLKQRLADQTAAAEAAPTLFGATLAPADRHPITDISAENCTPQMGAAGPWHERLPHFRMEYTPSSGQELQSEYFVPREHGAKAFRAIAGLRDRISPHLFVSEIRTVAADSLWMSPCYQQACVTIHFTWKPEWPAVQKLLPLIEERLAPFNARPHWGKLFTMAPSRLRSVYKRLAQFQELLRSYDPRGKFSNAFLETYILDRR